MFGFRPLYRKEKFETFQTTYQREVYKKQEPHGNSQNGLIQHCENYILSGQKLIKKAKNGQFWLFLKTLSLWSNSVTKQVNFSMTKIVEKCPKCQNSNETFWEIFNHFALELIRIRCWVLNRQFTVFFKARKWDFLWTEKDFYTTCVIIFWVDPQLIWHHL